MIPIALPLLGAEEEAAVLHVLASDQLAQGERVATLVQRFTELCHLHATVDTIRVPSDRTEWIKQFRMKGIDTAIHYPLPIHQQSFYRHKSSLFLVLRPGTRARVKGGNPSAHLPATETAVQQVLSLLVHPALSEEDLSTMARETHALCD